MPSHLVAFEVVIRVTPHSNLLHHLKPLVVLRVCHITIHLHTAIEPFPPADNNTLAMEDTEARSQQCSILTTEYIETASSSSSGASPEHEKNLLLLMQTLCSKMLYKMLETNIRSLGGTCSCGGSSWGCGGSALAWWCRSVQGMGSRYRTSSSMTALHIGHVGCLPCLHPPHRVPLSRLVTADRAAWHAASSNKFGQEECFRRRARACRFASRRP